MLQAIAEHYGHLFGPLRLLGSYLFLAGFASGASLIVTWFLLPALWGRLPRDQGRAFAVGAEASIGKPMGAGIIFVPVFAAVMLLTVPATWPHLTLIGCVLASMAVGFLDDRKRGGFSEYTLGAFDLVISVLVIGIFSAYMLYDLKQIIDGGETNYISATLGLYLSLFNVFQSLLALLGIFGGERD